MAHDRIKLSRQPTASDTLAAPIGILPRREGRPGGSTLFFHSIAATHSARVRDTREGSSATLGSTDGRRPRLYSLVLSSRFDSVPTNQRT